MSSIYSRIEKYNELQEKLFENKESAAECTKEGWTLIRKQGKKSFCQKNFTLTREVIVKCCENGYEENKSGINCIPKCNNCKPGHCTAPYNCSKCLNEFWGKNCINRCNCLNNESCDDIDGSCTCSSGFLDYNCSHPCPPNQHGVNCSNTCNCGFFEKCHYITGNCSFWFDDPNFMNYSAAFSAILIVIILINAIYWCSKPSHYNLKSGK